MAVTTYNKLYSLLKENEVYVEYEKTGGILGIKMTLNRELIPESDGSLINYDTSISIGEWSLSGDSDGALDIKARSRIEAASMTYPAYIKAFSTNYGEWMNLEINSIKSFQAVAS